MLKPSSVVKIILLISIIWAIFIGINSIKEVNFGLFTIKFPTAQSIIQRQIYTVNSWPSSNAKKQNKNINTKNVKLKATLDSLSIIGLQHPPNTQNALYPFYQKIKNEKSKQLIRILYYGDSQIEGDRISSVLRSELQNIWGGTGTGFLPLSENNFGKPSAQITLNNWQKFQLFNSKINAPHNAFGFTGYFHQLIQPKLGGSFTVKGTPLAILQTQFFTNIKILINTKNQLVTGEISSKTHSKIAFEIPPSNQIQNVQIDFNSNLNQSINFSLSSLENTVDFYGLSFDSDTGITVDNIPMRGSSYIQLQKINFNALQKQFSDLNVGLIIYQFGINIVPNILTNYDFYEKQLTNELLLLKKLVPNAAILVVGISDMCYFKDNQYKSYPNLSLIKQAQKNAAFYTNCAFWDLQDEMGGENAMLDWVNATPPLAQPDHVHFSPTGSKIIGKKLAKAILNDFYDFKSFED